MLRDRFHQEARRLLDQAGEDGSASLPTVQAYYLTSMYECAVGINRVELIQNCEAFGSVRRHAIDHVITTPTQPPDQEMRRDRRAVSFIVWGSYCIERSDRNQNGHQVTAALTVYSLKAICYMNTPSKLAPSLPRYFQIYHQEMLQSSNGSDGMMNNSVWQLLSAICDLSETLVRAMHETSTLR